MTWLDTFRTATEAVRTHRLRSALTMLGILIGITAVVLTVGLGQGAKAQVQDQINELGTNLLVISPGSTTDTSGERGGFGSASTLTVQDAEALRSKAAAPDIEAVAAASTSTASLVNGSTNWTTTLTGTTPSWEAVRSRGVSSGRFVSADDERDAAAVVVLGPDTAGELFQNTDPIGETVSYNGVKLEVIGVLEALSSSDDTTNNDLAIVPLSTYSQRLVGGTDRDSVSSISVKATSADTLSAAYQEANALLLNTHGITASADADFSIATQESILTAATSVDDTLTVMLGGIAIISLLVGGIGVMNIMLVSVTERIREIGLRKALGARPRLIRRQFLVEASVLGLAGGVLGVAFGLLGAVVVPEVSDSRVILSVPAGLGAIAVAIGIGVVFGVYPASTRGPARSNRRAQERMTVAIDTSPDTQPSSYGATLFPNPSAAKQPWWRRRRRALAPVVVIALVASSLIAARAFGAANAGYRTATVATRDVDAQLNGVASIEPVSQAAVAFPTAGTVDSVSVKVGDSVSIGQPLATLDPEALNQTLHQQQAALAQAELALEQALNGESVTGSDSGDNPVQLTAAPMPSGADRTLTDAQQAVLTAQQAVDAALRAATNALDSATTVCATAGIGVTPSTPPTADALTACQTATAAVLTAQTEVNAAQQQLAVASSALDDLLAARGRRQRVVWHRDRELPDDAPAGDTDAAGRSDGSTASPSAADLVAYQKAVDAAAADVAVADQAIAQATIVSPIAGTVEAVTLAPGDAVDAGSTTETIVVVGPGGYEATTTVSVDDVTDVEVGQKAALLPDGSKQSLAGTVSSISITPDADAATTSYRVVIGLDDPGADLDNGSTGSISIVTESSRAGLAVPTSAVTTNGDRHVVTMLDGTTTEPVPVEVGVIGDIWTEITDGLRAGQEVVLADLAEPLPGSATESSGNGTDLRGPGGFNGGGGPPVFRFDGP